MSYATIGVGVSSIIWAIFRESVVWSSSRMAIGTSRMAPRLNSSAKKANDSTGRKTVSTKYIG